MCSSGHHLCWYLLLFLFLLDRLLIPAFDVISSFATHIHLSSTSLHMYFKGSNHSCVAVVIICADKKVLWVCVIFTNTMVDLGLTWMQTRLHHLYLTVHSTVPTNEYLTSPTDHTQLSILCCSQPHTACDQDCKDLLHAICGALDWQCVQTQTWSCGLHYIDGIIDLWRSSHWMQPQYNPMDRTKAMPPQYGIVSSNSSESVNNLCAMLSGWIALTPF